MVMGENLTKLPERNLDVLRATAVSLVVLDHGLSASIYKWALGFDPWYLGRIGVLIFFVHTSLVLMSSIERGGDSGNWIRRFYTRRAFRIYPLAIVCILLVVGFSIPAGVGSHGLTVHYTPFAKSVVVSNLLLVQNLNGAPNVIGVLWSLPLEVQMYLILPFAYLLARRSLTGTAIGFLFCIVLALAFPAMSARLPGLWRLNVVAFSPFFMTGVLAYALLRAGYRMGELDESRVTRTAHWIAKYSYGIYLVHVPLLWLWMVPLGSVPAVVRWAGWLVSTGMLSVALFKIVEHPMITLGNRVAMRLNRRPLVARVDLGSTHTQAPYVQ
jgi:peptidoglycan/LPS O-acetylase OafA/YrhL